MNVPSHIQCFEVVQSLKKQICAENKNPITISTPTAIKQESTLVCCLSQLIGYQQFSNSSRSRRVVICCFPFLSDDLTQICGRTNSCCNFFINIGNCVLHKSLWWIPCCDCSCFYCVLHSPYCHFHRIWWMHVDATAHWGLLLLTILKACIRQPLQPAFAHLQLIVFNFVLSLLYKKPSWLIMVSFSNM